MTPLERVAAKLAALHPAWRETPWASIGAETRELFIEDARDVLLEIREPSEGMALAGEIAGDAAAYPAGVGIETFGDEAELGHYGALSVWQAMIDAALSE